jgi:hypothetical protein
MSVYAQELLNAAAQGKAAHAAIEAWLDRPPEAPNDTPAAVLEGHAQALRRSRATIVALVEAHGTRDDLAAALADNSAYHTTLGLRIPGEE